MVRLLLSVIVIVIIILILNSCNSTRALSLGTVQNGQINLKGAYLNKGINFRCNDSVQYSIYFLYSNGVILYAGTTCNSDIASTFNKMDSDDFQSSLNDQRGDITHWGSLKIVNEHIEFEMYTPRASPIAVIRSGKILSDTAFVITRFVDNYHKRKSTEIEEFYYLKPLTFKIDSTNKFVK
jgi:hypothetical protein